MKGPINPRPPRECRKRPSRRLVEWILSEQGGRCLACGATLSKMEFDHVIPLGLGGSNSPDNWAALCPGCHRSKTRADLKQIAKAKRQRRYHETGRSRASSLKNRLDGTKALGPLSGYKKCMNGMIVQRCGCARCRDK